MESRSIRYRLAECPLGSLLLARTSRGVCNLRLGSDPCRLVEELLSAFPFARSAPDADRLDAWIEALLRRLDGAEHGPAIPLDVTGSPFQRRVWSAVAAIPSGATRSYAEIARVIDAPRAARAVARACASNPVPLLIPCHRVVASDGGLGGYRHGIARKRALLLREQRRPGPRGALPDQSASATAIPY